MRWGPDHEERWRPLGERYMVSDLGRAITLLSGSMVKGRRRFSLMHEGRTYYRFLDALEAVAIGNAEWREVGGFPRYLVSRAGAVARLLELQDNGKGYLYINTTYVRVGIHRAVCAAFHGEAPMPDADAAHHDDDKANNHACNLRWATRTDNMTDAHRLGSLGAGNRKLSAAQVVEIRCRKAAGESTSALALEYGVRPNSISRIASGRARNYRVPDAA